MKKLSILTILILHTIIIKSQCLEQRTAYEAYYEKNNSNLDPIEGFWSVTISVKLYLNGELVKNYSQSQASERAVIKDGTSFLACHKYGGYPYTDQINFAP